MNENRVNTTLCREHHSALKALAAMKKISLSELVDIAISKYLQANSKGIMDYAKMIEGSILIASKTFINDEENNAD